MGSGYIFTCQNCGEKNQVLLGCGYLFSLEYEKTIKEIARGEYGEEMAQIVNNEPFTAVDAENYLYFCRHCGHWETAPGLSLYCPDDLQRYLEKPFGDKTVKEWGHIPYVMNGELEKKFHVRKRYYHKCSECGNRMKKATGKKLPSLRCPTCNGQCAVDTADFILWD